MEISLIRHGRSLLTESDKMTCMEFKEWVGKYDFNGVFEESLYPSETLEKVTTAKIVLSSNLKRSVESARLLNTKVKIVSDCLFRETELPSIPTKLFNVRLKPNIWAVILRLLWFSGYSNECESFRQAKDRAGMAVQLLIDYAHEHKSIALVGHGFFNMLIAKELQKKGWKGKSKVSARHWNCTTYSLLD